MHNVCVFDVCVYVCAGVSACACVLVHTSVNVGVSVRRLHVRTQINMHVSARITLVIESPTFFPRRINGTGSIKKGTDGLWSSSLGRSVLWLGEGFSIPSPS